MIGIGIWCPKWKVNVGTLWRSAYQLGADVCFIVGARYTGTATDTTKCHRHIPIIEFTEEGFLSSNFFGAELIGIEISDRATSLKDFSHPKMAVYILGAEDFGLPKIVLDRCKSVISIEWARVAPYNVAVSGSIVLHDRLVKELL